MANKEHFMLAEKHQVSIIIPTHNRKAFLRQALNALVEQTYPHEQFELVVVVDGCTDGSLEMLQEFSSPFNLRIFDQEQKGAGAARNQGAVATERGRGGNRAPIDRHGQAGGEARGLRLPGQADGA